MASQPAPTEFVSRDQTEPQQAAATGPTATNVQDDGKVGFKEQVVAQAKIIRGTLLNRPEEKDFGHKILNNDISTDKEVITTRGAAPPSQ